MQLKYCFFAFLFLISFNVANASTQLNNLVSASSTPGYATITSTHANGTLGHSMSKRYPSASTNFFDTASYCFNFLNVTNTSGVIDSSTIVPSFFTNPVCTNPGVYYVLYRDNTSSTTFFSPFQYNGTTSPITAVSNANATTTTSIFSSTLKTRFLTAQFIGTSSVSLNLQYYLDSLEIDTTKQAFNPTAVRIRYAERATTTFETDINNIDNQIFGNSTTTFFFPILSDGTYDLSASFYNFAVDFNNSPPPFKDSYIYISFTISGGVLTAVSSIENYSDVTEKLTIQYQECSISSISGCINNAFIYLFIPNEFTTQKFSELNEELKIKSPFVYIYQIPNLYNSLFNTPQNQSLDVSVTTPIGDIQFMSEAQLTAVPLSNQIKTVISALIYLFLALWLYNKAKNVFNYNQAI